jgi:hypothetical protein
MHTVLTTVLSLLVQVFVLHIDTDLYTVRTLCFSSFIVMLMSVLFEELCKEV